VEYVKITEEDAKLGPYKSGETWYLPSDFFWAIGGDMAFGMKLLLSPVVFIVFCFNF